MGDSERAGHHWDFLHDEHYDLAERSEIGVFRLFADILFDKRSPWSLTPVSVPILQKGLLFRSVG